MSLSNNLRWTAKKSYREKHRANKSETEGRNQSSAIAEENV